MDERRVRYEVRTQRAMLVLALLFLVVYALPIIQPHLPAPVLLACTVANLAIWAVFIADYLIRVALAERRRHYIRTHLIDLLIIALPMLRPLRALRVFTVAESLLLRSPGRLYVRAAQVIAAATALVVFIGAVAELSAERSAPGSRITTFADALWWAITTVTTVGYGDIYPVTGLGRIIAAALMLLGITLLGLVTATVAGWFVRLSQRLEREVEEEEESTRLADVVERLDRIEEMLRERIK